MSADAVSVLIICSPAAVALGAVLRGEQDQPLEVHEIRIARVGIHRGDDDRLRGGSLAALSDLVHDRRHELHVLRVGGDQLGPRFHGVVEILLRRVRVAQHDERGTAARIDLDDLATRRQ